MTQDEYVAAIKSAAITIESGLIIGALATTPLFSNPITYWLMQKIVTTGVTWLVNQQALGVFFVYTDFRVSAQGQDFVAAALAHQQAKTPEEKANAEAALIDKFRKFAKFTK